ncbi:hypothetical protein ACFV14_20920 [Streptomyces zaomyceticus]|uniref:hypothetical protein n=1 Tax=Streptomyces zaomyceticus TaxID=68286 RepID=UPI0036CBF82C
MDGQEEAVRRRECFSRRPPFGPTRAGGGNGSTNAHCPSVRPRVVDFRLHLADPLPRLRRPIRRSTSRYRWDGHPTTRRFK